MLPNLLVCIHIILYQNTPSFFLSMGAAHIFKPLRTKRMLALHLSRFLPGTPPSETLQKINAFVHEEYYDRIVYCIYWFMVLLFGIPIVGMALPFIMFYELLFCWLVKDRFIEPGNDKEESVISSPTTAKTTTTTTMKKYVVVITGCDSGIGKELALRLAGEGFVVFAGCLQKESFNDLSGVGISTSIYPYLVDVTKDEPVNAFAEAVLEWMKGGGGEGNNNKKEEIRVLHSLINNAGVGILGYCDWLDLKDYEKCMDVNYFGVIRMTKAFLPILKKQSISGVYTYSQIMNVVSVAGLNSATGFAASTYEGSKYAVEAFTNALRLELRMFGIRVVALNPSFFDTPLSNNVKGRVVQWKEKPSTQEEYGNDFIEKYAEHCETMMTSARWELKVLIDSIVRVVKSKYPPAQLLVGLDRYIHATLTMLPQWARHFLVQLMIPPQIPAAVAGRPRA